MALAEGQWTQVIYIADGGLVFAVPTGDSTKIEALAHLEWENDAGTNGHEALLEWSELETKGARLMYLKTSITVD